MPLNIHPLFVHFPIALLTIYSGMEIFRFKFLLRLPYWFYVKAILVIVGSLSAVVTIQTGELIKQQFIAAGEEKLVQAHSSWALSATVLFSVLGVCYLVAWINTSRQAKMWIEKNNFVRTLWGLLTKIQKLLIETPLAIVAALAGLVAITTTGALGGALTYGPDIDPAVKFIYNLLVK